MSETELSEVEDSDHESSDGSSKDTNTKVSKEFQEHVIKYAKIDDIIEKKKQEMTELRKQLKPHKEFISKHLEKLGETEIEITNGKIKKIKNEKPASLNMDLIKEVLLSNLKDPKEVNELLDRIDDKRPINKTTDIKRIKNKKEKTNKNKQKQK